MVWEDAHRGAGGGGGQDEASSGISPYDVGDEMTEAFWIGSLEFLAYKVCARKGYVGGFRVVRSFLEYVIK